MLSRGYETAICWDANTLEGRPRPHSCTQQARVSGADRQSPAELAELSALGASAASCQDKDAAKLAYFEAAKAVKFPIGAVGDGQMPPGLKLCIKFLAERRHEVADIRAAHQLVFSEVGASLEPLSARMLLRQTPSAKSCAEHSHPAMWAALVTAFNLPDTSLAGDMCVSGMPVVGRARDTGLFRLKPPEKFRRQPLRVLFFPVTPSISHERVQRAPLAVSGLSRARSSAARTTLKRRAKTPHSLPLNPPT